MREQEKNRQDTNQNINTQIENASYAQKGIVKKPNHTGIPDDFKTFVEASSGVSLDEVQVHYNSEKPAQENTNVYSEGTNIYVAPNAEDELSTKVWQVVRYLRKQKTDEKTTMPATSTPPTTIATDKGNEILPTTTPEESSTEKKGTDEKQIEQEQNTTSSATSTPPETIATDKGNEILPTTTPEESSTEKKGTDKKQIEQEQNTTSSAASTPPETMITDPHEITAEESANHNKLITSTQIKEFSKKFEENINKAKTEEALHTVVKEAGLGLWKEATKTVQASKGNTQTGNNWNDVDIYRARLNMCVLLRKSKNPLLDCKDNKLLPKLIYSLEQTSRGMTSVNFSDKAEKKILISGFDPFKDAPSNPSGLVAMYFDGKTIGNANIQTAVFPVRYEDFDNGIVENFFGEHMSEVDAILTVSYTPYSPNIDIDRFSANYRGEEIEDNNNKESKGPIVKGGKNFYESSLPHEEIMSLNKGRANDRKYYYPQDTEIKKGGKTIPNGETEDNKQLTEKKAAPTLEELNKEGTPISGPGGNFLSNEIHYRVSKMRTENDATKEMPQGHLHIQNPNNHETFMEDMNSLIKKVLATINKPKK